MKARAFLWLTLLLTLLAAAGPADAGRPKSPYWVVVNPAGNLVGGNGVVSVERVFTGLYEIQFGTDKGAIDIQGCAFAATLYDESGFITIRVVALDTLRVFTLDNLPTPHDANIGFHLIAACPR